MNLTHNKLVVAFAIIASVLFSLVGFKVYNYAQALSYYGRCYEIKEMGIALQIVGYEQKPMSLYGEYYVEGMFLYVIPFSSTERQKDFQVILEQKAVEFDCHAEETEK